jgi:hypothetical protein
MQVAQFCEDGDDFSVQQKMWGFLASAEHRARRFGSSSDVPDNSFLGGRRFEYRPEHLICWRLFLVIFLSPSWQKPENTLELRHCRVPIPL